MASTIRPANRQNRQNGSARKNRGSDPSPARSRDTRIFRFPATVSKPELLDGDGSSDKTFRQFLYDFSVLGSHLEFARAYLASELGLSSPQYNILMIIAQYQGANGVGVSDVAQHLHVTTAFVTGEGGKLEQAGLIEKRQNPKDGRGVLLRLTRQGEAHVLRIGPKRLLVNDHLFASLSGEDFIHLARSLARLIDDFSNTIKMLRIMQRK